MFHLFSYSFQLPRTTRTHNSVLYPGANQRFSTLCRWQRNKSYSRGWISVSLQLKIKKGSIDLCHTVAILLRRFKKLCLCTGSLVPSTRLAIHKQSFLNLLRQNGRHVTKVSYNSQLLNQLIILPYFNKETFLSSFLFIYLFTKK